ncbi:hypothetical protein V491_00419 [Pseudogymnoascus sp. VKM F-3775]|nr:hypothetical protein V491_00419 [Pseudogymnoascus sp. VKM F-3775]
MPAIYPGSPLNTLVDQNITATSNATIDALQVVCAWPVSGQYGIASRMFAPVTFRLSRIFFMRGPGRNTILLWTALLLAGLLSLLVEFLRAKPFSCKQDEFENPISSDPTRFPYNTTCGLTCSVEKGPFSSLREGSGNNIYVIPAPNKLTFGTATLFAAAGCVQVILSLISMWGDQLESNWQRLIAGSEENKTPGINSVIMRKNTSDFNRQAKIYLRLAFLPFLMAALVAVIVIGERNLFSSQLRYQTEPMASIGQWAPCTGAVLSVLWAYCADGGYPKDEFTDEHAGKTRNHGLGEISRIRVDELSEDSLSTILRRPSQTLSPLRPLATATSSITLTRRLSAPH